MTEPVFVDTNVLVNALDERDPRKQVAAWSWRQELCRTGRGRISFQVLQECYVQLLRIWPDRRTEARAEVRDPLAWKPVAVDVAILSGHGSYSTATTNSRFATR
jgi:predicted nucleic acid-binding protein